MKKQLTILFLGLPFLLFAQNEPKLVKDIRVGKDSSDPFSFVHLDRSVYFLSNENDTIQLWKTDGSEVGTEKIDLHLDDYEKITGNLILVPNQSRSETINFFTRHHKPNDYYDKVTFQLNGFNGITRNQIGNYFYPARERDDFNIPSPPGEIHSDFKNIKDIEFKNVLYQGSTISYEAWHSNNKNAFLNLYSTSLNWTYDPSMNIYENGNQVAKTYLDGGNAFFLRNFNRTRINRASIDDGDIEFGNTTTRQPEDRGNYGTNTLSLVGNNKTALGVLGGSFFYVGRITSLKIPILFAGTTAIKVGVNAASSAINFIDSSKNKLFFITHDKTIWGTDGTENGTQATKAHGTDIEAIANRMFILKDNKSTIYEFKGDSAQFIGSLPITDSVDTYIDLNKKAYVVSYSKILYRIDSDAVVLIGYVPGFNGNYATLNDSTMIFSCNTDSTGQEVFKLSLTAPILKPDLSLQLTSDTTDLPLFGYFNFYLKVKNEGNASAHNIKIKCPIFDDQLKRTNSESASKGIYNNWLEEWTVDSLLAGDSATLRIRTFVHNLSPLSRFAQIIAQDEEDTDSKPNNNTSDLPNEDDETLLKLPDPTQATDLAITIAASIPTFVKYHDINYTIEVKNQGAKSASNIKISFPFPPKTVNGGSVTPSGGKWEEWCSGNIQCYIWTIPSLPKNTSAKLNVPLFVLDADAPIIATTKILSLFTSDTNPSNNEATITTQQQVAHNQLISKQSTPLVPIVIQKLSPVPTDDLLTVQLDAYQEQVVSFKILDALGRTIQTEKRALDKGKNNVTIDVQMLPQGLYFIQPDTHQARNVPIKFIKQ